VGISRRSSGGTASIQEEGAAVTGADTTLNFIGAGVTAAQDGTNPNQVNITIPGAAASAASVTITTGTTAGAATHDIIEVNSAGGAIVYTLEAPATFGADRTVWFQDVGGLLHLPSAALTISRAAGGNINGAAANYVVTAPYAHFGVYCDGTNFFIRG